MKAMAQKSWRRGEPLHLVELPTREPRGDEVRVRVAAIGVNPVDYKMRSFGPLRLAARLLGPPPPVIVGVDFSGVVDALGPEVRGIALGAPVCGGTSFARRQYGSYADTVIVREDQLCPLPAGVDLEVAGALPVAGVTAWMAVIDIGRLRPAAAGEPPPRVLVLGASGGVGQLAVQVAKLHGAFVAGVCSARNVARVRALGADEVLDYGAGDPLAAAAALGRYQVVVDCVGTYAHAACRALLRPGGRHSVVAGERPSALLSPLVPPFTSKAILGRTTRARLEPVLAAVAEGSLRVEIAERLPLVQAERAHELSRSGRMTGKLVLLP
jgi:NADPH:quinone reductase-like Zn-dependent oxidoreductase